ncbi:MAG: SCO family protein [Natronospirillum sp.]|uniref:SCO family protein n=1 Tax=Natronospirillum sp. TaxID=2812955 RepID=UPI0025EE6B0F|nr:SCO family protein [Natronospirillum sp.]MCH8550350.1 SCO family protein [Natronospirillum sp.]
MKKLLVMAAAFSAFSLVFIYFILPAYMPEPEPERDFSAVGGDFQLETLDGPISRDDFAGQAVMLFFGFTHCPDYCLASLATKRQVLAELSDEELERVSGLFVSVDPDRDDLETLAEYTDFFHPRIVGATSSKSVIDEMTGKFFATYYFVDTPDSDLEYLVEHTTRTYLLGPDGQVADIFSYDDPYTAILARIRQLI